MVKFAYYPGNVARAASIEVEDSIQPLCSTLGIELIEIPKATSDGGNILSQASTILQHTLVARNMALAEEKGLDLMTTCATSHGIHCDTIDVMNQVNFDSAYTFKYSPRKGTKATEYDDQIEESVKQNRLSRVIALQKSHTLLRNEVYVGSIENVLIEKQSKRNKSNWTGRTDSNKWVVFDKSVYNVNDIVPVLITESRGITLHGEISKKVKAA